MKNAGCLSHLASRAPHDPCQEHQRRDGPHRGYDPKPRAQEPGEDEAPHHESDKEPDNGICVIVHVTDTATQTQSSSGPSIRNSAHTGRWPSRGATGTVRDELFFYIDAIIAP